MSRIPDQFDLLVRKAQTSSDPVRQVDYVLGALAGLPAWHFLNVGSAENPHPAQAELGGKIHLLVFSDRDRVENVGPDMAGFTIPTAQAMAWCLQKDYAGLLVNPPEEAFVLPIDHLRSFYEEWMERDNSSGFWIPNMTSEEEDFWEEHGL